jgi:hypothetical protein
MDIKMKELEQSSYFNLIKEMAANIDSYIADKRINMNHPLRKINIYPLDLAIRSCNKELFAKLLNNGARKHTDTEELLRFILLIGDFHLFEKVRIEMNYGNRILYDSRIYFAVVHSNLQELENLRKIFPDTFGTYISHYMTSPDEAYYIGEVIENATEEVQTFIDQYL